MVMGVEGVFNLEGAWVGGGEGGISTSKGRGWVVERGTSTWNSVSSAISRAERGTTSGQQVS